MGAICVKGVIDLEDLPLSISGEKLQGAALIAKLPKALTRKVRLASNLYGQVFMMDVVHLLAVYFVLSFSLVPRSSQEAEQRSFSVSTASFSWKLSGLWVSRTSSTLLYF